MARLRLHRELVLDHVLVEQRSFALAEREHQHIERRLVLVVQMHGRVGHEEERQRHVVFQRDVAIAVKRHRRLVGRADIRPARNRAVVLGDPGERLGLVEVAADGEGWRCWGRTSAGRSA